MKATLKEIAAIAATYVATAKQVGTWSASYDYVSGCLEKMGKQVTLDTLFYDDLTELDGDELPYGATIEEWYQDLIKPVTFDVTGANNNSPSYPTFRPVLYDYPLGLQTFKTTDSYVKYKKACLDAESYGQFIAMNHKRLEDSIAVFKYDNKLQLMGNFISKVEAAFTGATTIVTSTAYAEGLHMTDGTDFGVVVKAIPATNTTTSVSGLVAAGYMVQINNLKEVVAKPTDTATGEAFIQAVKVDVEHAKKHSEGNSLSGSSMGAEEGLKLYIKEGIVPVLDVQVLAGAFNPEKLGLPIEVKVVRDFGSYSGNAYAILVDPRAIRLHRNEDLTLNSINADGAFLNICRHVDYTGFISGNAYIKVYEAA